MSRPLAPTVGGLPPTSGIQDPQARAFCDALVAAWNLRNGSSSPESGSSFVTKAEFETMTNDALYKTLTGAISSMPVSQATTFSTIRNQSQINRAIDALADAIRKSVLYQVLSTELTTAIDERIAAAGSGAGISEDVSIRVAKDAALASAVNKIWASIGGSTAVIADAELAGVTPSAATATKWNQVVTAVTDPNTGQVNSGSIKEELNTYSNAANGTFNAIYSVRAQLTVGGQTAAGGFGLAATAGAGSAAGPTIDFGVLANKFWIGAPAAGYDPVADYATNNQFPFIVLSTPATINGVSYDPGVYMKKAVIGKAAIGTAEIADLAVKTLKIDGNAVSIISGASVVSWTGVETTIVITSNDLRPGFSTVPVVITGTFHVSSAFRLGLGLNQVGSYNTPGNLFEALPGPGCWSATVVAYLPVGTHIIAAFYEGGDGTNFVSNTSCINTTITALVGKR